ncbi:hypothetical protein PQ478_12560 [Alkalihalophilus pseudofirmus]|uniref:hypothetical protein n=1 Tax=Alkalihalophilus pseudofirmus TaxID=79885 RepID=UPI00259BC3D2|nr:hypothetical protein [Alkalihalophilus pseudofirmus]WEG15371.1 hypothetical protein PQ478_12560 [Alkalihalophilus pseudofirmus]
MGFDNFKKLVESKMSNSTQGAGRRAKPTPKPTAKPTLKPAPSLQQQKAKRGGCCFKRNLP